MGQKAIAEGIETSRQIDRLLEMGCEYGQGYYFSQPLDAASALTFMRQQFAAAHASSASAK